MRTPTDALAAAQQITTYQAGYCLRFVCDMYQASGNPPGMWPTAISAWNQSPHNTGWPPEPGYPLYFSGAQGHVCLYINPDTVYTTWTGDNGTGYAGQQPLSLITEGWGRTYLGWSDFLVGNMIPPDPPKPTPAPTPAHQITPVERQRKGY